MGGRNPQDMFKRGMPMLGQVPGAVTKTAKKSPLGQLHKQTSDLIEPKKEEDLEFTKQDIKPLGDVGVPPVEEDLEFTEEDMVWPPKLSGQIDETITDKEFIVQELDKSWLTPEQASQLHYSKELGADAPLETLQGIYRSTLKNSLIKLLLESKDKYIYPEGKIFPLPDQQYTTGWDKMDLATLKDELAYFQKRKSVVLKNKGVSSAQPVTGKNIEGDMHDKIYLMQKIKELNPEEYGSQSDDQPGMSLDNLQMKLRKEIIGKLDDYWSGTNYPGDKNAFDDMPLDTLLSEYNTMNFDQSEVGGGQLKKAVIKGVSPDPFTNVTDEVDKPKDSVFKKVKDHLEERMRLGSDVLEVWSPVGKILKAYKAVRFGRQRKRLEQSNIERKQRAEDMGFDLMDKGIHLAPSFPVRRYQTVTEEEVSGETDPYGEASGPIGRSLDSELFTNPTLKAILTGTDRNTDIRKALRTLWQEGHHNVKELPEKESIKRLPKRKKELLLELLKSGKPISAVEIKNIEHRDITEVYSKEREEDLKNYPHGKKPERYRVPVFNKSGEPVITERSLGAFQRYPRVVFQDGQWQSPGHQTGATYFGPGHSVGPANRASQRAKWNAEAIEDVDKWEAMHGMSWDEFTKKYADYKNNPEKFKKDNKFLSMESAVRDYEYNFKSIQGRVVAQQAVFRSPVLGRDVHGVLDLPDTITRQEYEDLMQKTSDFPYKDLPVIKDIPEERSYKVEIIRLARKIAMENVRLAYAHLDKDNVVMPEDLWEMTKEGEEEPVILNKNKKLTTEQLFAVRGGSAQQYRDEAATVLPRWQDFEETRTGPEKRIHVFQEAIKALGFTGARIKDEAGSTTAMIDPTAIRAPWASFDPKKKGWANILASILAGGLITKAQLKRMQKENRPERRTRDRKPQPRKRGQHGKRTRNIR